MPSLLDKIKNRWNSGAALAPNYGPIGPTAPRDLRTPWRQRLARWIGSGQSTPLRTASYRPLHQAWFNQPRDLPPFSFETINSMLLDPGIRLNLAMRAAPIYGVQFAYPAGVDASGKTTYQPGIQARNPAVAAWVARQLSTIWHNDLPAILRAQVYGWAGGEVSLRLSDQNFIEIDRLVARHPGDVRLLKCEGGRYGIKVLRVQEGGEANLEFPSAWFHAFRPDDGEDYGTSILLGAYSPWADKWFNGGALDTRRLFMHKDAYGGMKIAYPEEDIYIGSEINPVSARDIAAQMVEQRKAGGTITYPSTLDFQGNPKWRIEEATTANNPQHILQYPKDCDDEIRIGMEIPDDVISADGSGAWAGKRIPLAAFYASLDTWVVQLLSDLRHTLEPLILQNWGRAEDFEICHKPLALQAMEQQGQAASPAANTAATTAQPTTTAQPPDRTAQTPMIAGFSPQNAPHRMSTRPNLSDKERQDRYERSRLIAALLTHIYGPDAERYFDEAFGTNLSGTSSPSNIRHPHEFQRMSSQISRSISFNRVPWDPLKHPRGRDGRFIEKYGIDAFNESKAKINASLDPNASSTTGRTSDEVRPLLEHLNLLDQLQLHNLLSDHEAITTIAPDSLIQRVNYQVNGDEEQEATDGSQPEQSDDQTQPPESSRPQRSPDRRGPAIKPPNRKDNLNNVEKALGLVNGILQKQSGVARENELRALLSWMTLNELKEFAKRFGIFHSFDWLANGEYQFEFLVDRIVERLSGTPEGFQLSRIYPLTDDEPPYPKDPPSRKDNLAYVDKARDAINVILAKDRHTARLNRLIWVLSKLTMAELQELADRYLTFSENDVAPSIYSPYLNLLLKIALKLGRNVPDDFRLGGSASADNKDPFPPPDAPKPPAPKPPQEPKPISPEDRLPSRPTEPKPPEVPKAPPKPIEPPKITLPEQPLPANPVIPPNIDTAPEEEPDEGIWEHNGPDTQGKRREALPPVDDQQFQSNVLRILGFTSRGLKSSLSRGGALLGIKRAAGDDYDNTRGYSSMKSISVPLTPDKSATIYLDPRGKKGGQPSSAMIYYDPSLNESEVAQALESQDFVDAWNAHQSKSTGTPYNVEGGFDVVDKFKSDQKEAFAEAAPIIHDLVMDVVRTTGGEIPYAMYVISEHGFVEYLGGELESKIDDIKSTVQFAKEHPLQAGGMAVIAIAANGKRIGAKGTKKRYGIFKKPNPSKGKPDINVVPPDSPAGGRVATGQPELPQPNKGKDAKSSKKELQSATVSDPAKVGSSGNSKNSPNSNNNSSGSNSSNDNSTNSPSKRPPSKTKPKWDFKTGDEKNFVHFNETHKNSEPEPKGLGKNGGGLQSHHGLQGGWAKHHLEEKYNYDYRAAPTVTIESGDGLPHDTINRAQRKRRLDRLAAGKGPWDSTLQEELEYIVDDLNEAGFTKDTIVKVLEQQYKMLEHLKVPFTRIELD